MCFLILLYGNNRSRVTCLPIEAPLSRLQLLLCISEFCCLEIEALFVLSTGKAPRDVFYWCLLHVLLEVVERMLYNISHTKTRGLPDSSLCWLLLTHEDLDCCGFTCAVC